MLLAVKLREESSTQGNVDDPASTAQTLLLVEDNEDNRIIYCTVLRHLGYTVVLGLLAGWFAFTAIVGAWTFLIITMFLMLALAAVIVALRGWRGKPTA